jgi:hypothetical protein
MNFFFDFLFFVGGAAFSVFFSTAWQLGTGFVSAMQLPAVMVILAVFYLKEKYLPSLIIGMGIGLDIFSPYPFFTWTLVVGLTAAAGWWIGRNVLTNRALPSLLILFLVIRFIYFILQSSLSRLGKFVGGNFWYLPGESGTLGLLITVALELFCVVGYYLIHIRLRGEQSRMLTHVQ